MLSEELASNPVSFFLHHGLIAPSDYVTKRFDLGVLVFVVVNFSTRFLSSLRAFSVVWLHSDYPKKVLQHHLYVLSLHDHEMIELHSIQFALFVMNVLTFRLIWLIEHDEPPILLRLFSVLLDVVSLLWPTHQASIEFHRDATTKKKRQKIEERRERKKENCSQCIVSRPPMHPHSDPTHSVSLCSLRFGFVRGFLYRLHFTAIIITHSLVTHFLTRSLIVLLLIFMTLLSTLSAASFASVSAFRAVSCAVFNSLSSEERVWLRSDTEEACVSRLTLISLSKEERRSEKKIIKKRERRESKRKQQQQRERNEGKRRSKVFNWGRTRRKLGCPAELGSPWLKMKGVWGGGRCWCWERTTTKRRKEKKEKERKCVCVSD